MRLAKKILYLGSFVSFMSLFSVSVNALNFVQSFQPFWNLINYLLNVLPSGATKFVFYKFLIWMIMAVLLMILIPKLPFIKEGDETAKKNGKVLAWVLALMMSLAIPNIILDLIFTQYAFFGAFFLMAIVPALIFAATDKAGTRLRGFAFFVAGLTILLFTTFAQQAGWITFTQTMIDWLMIAGGIMMIVGAVMIIGGMGKSGNSTTSSIFGGDDSSTRDPSKPPEIKPGDPESNSEEKRELIGKISNIGDKVAIFKRDVDMLKRFMRKFDKIINPRSLGLSLIPPHFLRWGNIIKKTGNKIQRAAIKGTGGKVDLAKVLAKDPAEITKLVLNFLTAKSNGTMSEQLRTDLDEAIGAFPNIDEKVAEIETLIEEAKVNPEYTTLSPWWKLWFAGTISRFTHNYAVYGKEKVKYFILRETLINVEEQLKNRGVKRNP